ncbi:MAG: protein translocase subunit SecF, partial [Actinobacteria bacterium]|nr:protein translocase subunit SecF [Actinomycetota bacterium]
MMLRLGQIGGKLYRGEVSFDFVGRQRLWYTISGVILVISILALIFRGLVFSVDFKGGAIFEFPASSASLSQVQSAVSDGGISGAIVQQIHRPGQPLSWQVQTKALTGPQTVKLENTLSSDLGVNTNNITVTTVGPSWGGQITGKALEALIAFMIVIVLYLSIAFEWKMAVAAFIALLHDLVIATGVYALAGFQVSPATIIGLLTILGYSLYDTVVVFDKVRENTAGLLGGARSTYSQAANLALNQTLVRSINTSLIALLPVTGILVVATALLGNNNELEELALVLFIGMLSGTYSSIFIATPVLADLKEREPQYQALAKRVAIRASGGRAAAKRSVATAPSRGRSAAAADDPAGEAVAPGEKLTRRAGPDLAGPGLEGGEVAGAELEGSELAGTELAGSELANTGPRAVPAGRGSPGTARPGPRQQPRRSGGS